MAHIDEPPPGRSEVLPRLRKGDILTHCFRPFPNAPVFASGAVRPDMRLARERGVIFDIGHGMGSFDFEVARAMLEEGLAPDVISSDVHLYCVDGPAFDILVCMSKLLALGMPLVEVAARRNTTAGAGDRAGPISARWRSAPSATSPYCGCARAASPSSTRSAPRWSPIRGWSPDGIAIGGTWWPNEAADDLGETERFEAHAHHTHVEVARPAFRASARLADLGRQGCAWLAADARSGECISLTLVAASQRHLSPLRRERKGAKADATVPFTLPQSIGGEVSSEARRSEGRTLPGVADRPINRRRNSFHPRLDLQRDDISNRSATAQGCRHGTTALPAPSASTCCAIRRATGPGSPLHAGAEAPAWADLVGDLARDDRRHRLVHRLVAGAGDDRVGLQLRAVLEADACRRQRLDRHAAANA